MTTRKTTAAALRERYGRAAGAGRTVVLDPSNPKHAELCRDLADDSPVGPDERAALLLDMGIKPD